jgi:hypothetical protein
MGAVHCKLTLLKNKKSLTPKLIYLYMPEIT